MKKQIIVTLLILALAGTWMVTGCGNGGDDDDNGSGPAVDLATAIIGIWNTTKIIMIVDIQASMGVTMQANFTDTLGVTLDVTTPDTSLLIPGTYVTSGATGLDVYLMSTDGVDTLSGTYTISGNNAVFSTIMPVEMIQSLMEGNPIAAGITDDQQVTFELTKQ